jgi:WD40 repeat protein
MSAQESDVDQKPAARPSVTSHLVLSSSDVEMSTLPSTAASIALSPELPFLVTHWLDYFASQNQSHVADASSRSSSAIPEQQKAALAKIKSLTQELSNAFTTLGAYGTAAVNDAYSAGGVKTVGMDSEASRLSGLRHASFNDVSLRWSRTPANHLEYALNATQQLTIATNGAVEAMVDRTRNEDTYQWNLIATPLVKQATEGLSRPERLATEAEREQGVANVHSLLQPPTLVVHGADEDDAAASSNGLLTSQNTLSSSAREKSTSTIQGPRGAQLALSIASNPEVMNTKSADLSRKYNYLRVSYLELCGNLRRLERDLERANQTLQKAPSAGMQTAVTISASLNNNLSSSTIIGKHSDSFMEANRVSAHLTTRIPDVRHNLLRTQESMQAAQTECHKYSQAPAMAARHYNNPFHSISPVWRYHPLSSILHRVTSRDAPLPPGIERGGAGTMAATGTTSRMNLNLLEAIQRRPNTTLTAGAPKLSNSCLNKQTIQCRMSCILTMNAHLFYPVYCLRFDRTGRYFVTGADDQLVKLFVLGDASSHPKSQRPRMKPDRGATVVCTMRGHAGVITDIDVSLDNALLATGSEDGDCRVWGLRDGAPVAVLRGHVGGVTMVSFSLTTPYMLVTIAEDGYARVWDVREAALKRYGRVVGKHEEYLSPSIYTNMSQGLSGGSRGDSSCSLSPAKSGTSTVLANAISNHAATDDDDDNDSNDGKPNASAKRVITGDERTNSIQSVALEDPPLPPLPFSSDLAGAIAKITSRRPIGSAAGNCETSSSAARDAASNITAGAAVLPLPHGHAAGAVENARINNGFPAVAVPAAVVNDQDINNVNRMGPFAPAQVINGNEEAILDQGVKLLARLCHGNNESFSLEEDAQVQGLIGTRSRRRRIKVICLARCPIGGHFATGTDDGVARIWRDVDDSYLSRLAEMDASLARTVSESIDRQDGMMAEQHTISAGKSSSPTSRNMLASRLLATLPGHLNAITDIKYSHKGDRLLTASQKDGVVRIWSWDTRAEFDSASTFKNARQVMLRLVAMKAQSSRSTSAPGSSPIRGRRGASSAKGGAAASSNSAVQCDVAAWSANDLYVITSQSVPVKRTGPIDPQQPLTGIPIEPLSQILQVWDPVSGQCLIRIEGAHAAPCHVVVPHHSDASLLVSAGSDGVAHLWDILQGSRMESWENRLQHGALPDPKGKNKLCGFLDGCWREDGHTLILTDDCGRVSLFDTFVHRPSARPPTLPFWMKEQYFASDYYELLYDSYGYALDTRSNLPPHISPRAVRCNHVGTSHGDSMNYALSVVKGPLPAPVQASDERRRNVTRGALEVRHCKTQFGDHVVPSQASLCQDTSFRLKHVVIGRTEGAIIVKGPLVEVAEREGIRAGSTPHASRNPDLRRGISGQRTSPQRILSSRYNYLGYDDLAVSSEEEDAEEEDFVPSNGRSRRTRGRTQNGNERVGGESEGSESVSLVDSDTSIQHESDVNEDSPLPRSRRSRRRAETRQANGRSEGRRLGSRDRRPRANQRVSLRRRASGTRGRGDTRRLDSLSEVREPTRVSGRAKATPARYTQGLNSEDDDMDFVELLTTNGPPESADDYNGIYFDDMNGGHMWKTSRGANVKRDWLLRSESRPGFSGRQSYVPQVRIPFIIVPFVSPVLQQLNFVFFFCYFLNALSCPRWATPWFTFHGLIMIP